MAKGSRGSKSSGKGAVADLDKNKGTAQPTPATPAPAPATPQPAPSGPDKGGEPQQAQQPVAHNGGKQTIEEQVNALNAKGVPIEEQVQRVNQGLPATPEVETTAGERRGPTEGRQRRSGNSYGPKPANPHYTSGPKMAGHYPHDISKVPTADEINAAGQKQE